MGGYQVGGECSFLVRDLEVVPTRGSDCHEGAASVSRYIHRSSGRSEAEIMFSPIIARRVPARLVDPYAGTAIERKRPVCIHVHLDGLAEIAGVRWLGGKPEVTGAAVAKSAAGAAVVVVDVVDLGVVASGGG